MDDYPANSNYTKESKITPKESSDDVKKVDKVIEGEVVRRKKPLSKKFKELFVGGDSRTVGAYVMYEVLIPAAKDALADAMSQGVEKLLFGEARSVSRRGKPSGYTSYNSRYTPKNTPPWKTERPERSRATQRMRDTHDFDEIIIQTRGEAEDVIARLNDLIVRYEFATVGDLYDLVGISSEFTDEKWGWTDLRTARVVRVTGGYLLSLPRTEPVD